MSKPTQTDPAIYWQRRYEELKQFMADAQFDIERKEFDASQERHWDPTDFIYVSFALEATQDEDNAVENFGERKYDVYKLFKRGDE